MCDLSSKNYELACLTLCDCEHVIYACDLWLCDQLSGNYVIDVEASPLLREVVMNASRQTSPSTSFEATEPGMTPESLFDVWIQRSPSDNDNFAPR